jgi:hypothetical protein
VYALHLLGEIASPHEAADFGGRGWSISKLAEAEVAVGGGDEGAHPTATTMYREMGMSYWLEKAEAELKVLVA